jgi:hypothetical protein
MKITGGVLTRVTIQVTSLTGSQQASHQQNQDFPVIVALIPPLALWRV